MRDIALIATKDLRVRLRDRSAWLMGLLAPVVLAATISLALGGLGPTSRVRIAVADEDRGTVGALFVDTIEAPQLRHLVTVRSAVSREIAASLVRRGAVNAAIVVPAGLSNPVTPARLVVLARTDQLLGAGIARAVADGFMAHIAATRLAVATAASIAPAFTPQVGDSVARQATAAEASDVFADRSPGRVVPPATYYGPAMALLFLFFLAGFGARSFLAEQRDNTMARLLASPVRPSAVIAGKAAATFVLGLASLLVVYGVCSIGFHAHWGNPVEVVLLSAVSVMAVTALTALVTTFARTDDQASGYMGALTFVLGLIGGDFIATYQLPPGLRAVSALTPNGWALRGFSELAAGVASPAAVALPFVAVCAFAIVTGGLALRRADRLVAA